LFQAEIEDRDPGAVGILELQPSACSNHLLGWLMAPGVCALARWTLACPVCELLAEAQHLSIIFAMKMLPKVPRTKEMI